MRRVSKTYIGLMCGGWFVLGSASLGRAQSVTLASAEQSSCAAVLANDSTVGAHLGPTSPTSGARDTSARPRADSGLFGVGGARSGQADVILLVGIHADEVRFASQPHVRARLCWGGDSVRVVQRDNLPSPIVPGTTYRNVYIAVELIGRVNAECLADKIGVGNRAPTTPTTSVGSCAFLGGGAASDAQNTKPPPP